MNVVGDPGGQIEVGVVVRQPDIAAEIRRSIPAIHRHLLARSGEIEMGKVGETVVDCAVGRDQDVLNWIVTGRDSLGRRLRFSIREVGRHLRIDRRPRAETTFDGELDGRSQSSFDGRLKLVGSTLLADRVVDTRQRDRRLKAVDETDSTVRFSFVA